MPRQAEAWFACGGCTRVRQLLSHERDLKATILSVASLHRTAFQGRGIHKQAELPHGACTSLRLISAAPRWVVFPPLRTSRPRSRSTLFLVSSDSLQHVCFTFRVAESLSLSQLDQLHPASLSQVLVELGREASHHEKKRGVFLAPSTSQHTLSYLVYISKSFTRTTDHSPSYSSRK